MTKINEALANIGGTTLASYGWWSSSETSSNNGWCVYFDNGNVGNNLKYSSGRGRFVRDI